MTTIRDVAALAGVSVATVSRALSGNPRVTAATRERVTAAATELDYRPNAVAAAMRTGRTGAVGLVLGDITNPFMTRLAHHVETEVRQRGWVLAIACGKEDPAEQEAVASMLLRQRIDGLLIVLAGNPTPNLMHLIHAGTPVVAIDRDAGDHPAATIVADPTAALSDLAAHLADQGYRRPAIICGPAFVSTGGPRAELARQALIGAGFDPAAISVLEGDFSVASGCRAAREALDMPERPDVIVALSNLMTLGALEVLHEEGLEVGPQVGLVGYDDERWFTIARPSITAITQPIEDLARVSVQTLADLIEGQSVPPVPPLPGCRLVVRDSTRRSA